MAWKLTFTGNATLVHDGVEGNLIITFPGCEGSHVGTAILPDRMISSLEMVECPNTRKSMSILAAEKRDESGA